MKQTRRAAVSTGSTSTESSADLLGRLFGELFGLVVGGRPARHQRRLELLRDRLLRVGNADRPHVVGDLRAAEESQRRPDPFERDGSDLCPVVFLGERQQEVLRRFTACAEGAAKATGTKLTVTVNENAGYENMVFSTPLADRWTHHMRSLGVQVFEARDDERVGSTDMGNVMQVLPAIHPYIAISQESIPGHSIAFREAVRGQEAHENALVAAKALALTAIDVLADPDVLRRARAEFEERRAGGIVKGRS